MKPQNFKLSRRFLAFVALLLLFVGLGTIA